MNAFSYTSAVTVAEALAVHANTPGSTYLGGGTNLIDDWKLGVEQPNNLIDVRQIGLTAITSLPNGAVRIGAGATNSSVAYDERIRQSYPALSEAILSGASPQLRNAATTAGNLLQRTRCAYFRDTARSCNKRIPGSGCPAIKGINRSHAILGTSAKCIATHPSDMAVALMTFEAVVRTQSKRGERTIPISDLYVPYGEDPSQENVLNPGELVISVDLPANPWFASSRYVKARDRASYEFALASAAVAVQLDGGIVENCRISLGGVATKPWRAYAAEATLRGQKADIRAFAAAADAELKSAVAQSQNAFKLALSRRVIVHSLQLAAANRF